MEEHLQVFCLPKLREITGWARSSSKKKLKTPEIYFPVLCSNYKQVCTFYYYRATFNKNPLTQVSLRKLLWMFLQ